MTDQKLHPSEYLEFTTSNLSTSNPTPLVNDRASRQLTLDSTASHNDVANGHVGPRRGSIHQHAGAFSASEKEHRMTFTEGLKLYPKAVCWSALISLAIVMEGFDTALINSFYAFGEFRRTYGVLTPQGDYQVTTKWQTTLSNSAAASAIVGLFANGVLTERFGYRRTMIGALLALACFIFLAFFAVSIEMLLAAQILCGVSWGVFSTLTTTYAAEVVPLGLRGYLTANVNLCWLLGQIVATGTLRGLIDMRSTWSFRIPFGLQWVWILILLVIACLAPESPWWLVRKQRLKDAEKMLLRLTRRGYGFDAKDTVAVMEHTNLTEIRMNGDQKTNASYAQCFRGTNLRRTEIACMIFMIQNLSGLPIISFGAYFYSRIGFTQRQTFNLYMGMHGLAIMGSFVSVILMKYFGRRPLYLVGLSLQLVVLLAAGIVSTLPETNRTLWGTAALMITFIFVFDSMVAPLTYCIVAEVPSTRLRVKSVALARVAYNICCLITNIVQTRMLNPSAWNLRGKSAFFWAGACVFCIVYCYFRLPEFKGLSYLEIDLLFEKGAKASQFSVFQKKLASTGYFSFYDQESREPKWTETRLSNAFQTQSHVDTVVVQNEKI